MNQYVSTLLFVMHCSLGTPSRSLDNFIVNGQNATSGQFPFHVSLVGNQGQHICGGAIINEYHVLTAAHCKHIIRVRVGVTIRSSDPKILHNISDILIHPNYTDGAINDIAIVLLKTPIVFSGLAQPILVQSQKLDIGSPVIAIGFGSTDPRGGMADTLQCLDMIIMENDACRERLGTSKWNITDETLCAWNSHGKGICGGDSGSALISGGKVVGISCWIRNPCGSGNPDVFTRMSSYAEWVIENTGL